MKIKTFFRMLIAIMVVAVLAVTAVGCKKGDGRRNNPEQRPLSMSISTPDGVFNPFFSTSAYDSAIISHTQIGMLGTDQYGQIVCGDNEPVVVKDYRVTTAADNSRTTYEFIIKNGIRFSDGVPLTIKDVLFNLYLYLDPAYTGSMTIYSTKIEGLEAYRTQNVNATEGSMSSFEESFYDDANLRIDELIEYVQFRGIGINAAEKPDDRWTTQEKAAFEVDYATVAAEFLKELETDWNSIDVESYKEWGFTERWQIFMLNDGGLTELLARDEEGDLIKDEDGNYQLDTDEAATLREEMEEYTADNAGATEKDWAITEVHNSYFPKLADGSANIAATNAVNFEIILRAWVTADNIRESFAAEAKSAYFGGMTTRPVPTISGIDGTGKTNTDYHGNALGAEHEVLKITIRDVDPKAIWNFAFNVAPMHYYSSTNYGGKNYVEAFDESKGEFGFEFGSKDFMDNVINSSAKVGLPVGAGPYMASTATGSGTVSAGSFFNNNMIYFERNPYFETLGSGISNANIKYFRYKVVESDQIINSIANGDIDLGDPNATQENIQALDASGVAHREIDTSGYGYVGINPRFVPNINIRRAIMKAMDTSIITQNYYKGGLASLIWRPMSTTSWAYPDGVTVYSDTQSGISYAYDSTGYDIEDIVTTEGYLKVNGVYQKEIAGFGIDRLDYEFTIAGGSTDHPAYAMFLEAAAILNKVGFAVKVVNSATALSDLTTGKLEVWAAAWTSTIDPDMYQIYHKDSRASSVNNWGYPQIKANKNLYATEWSIINRLSELIDAGRETVVQEERETIYASALDLLMELAVEMPTYQRKDMTAYNASLLDRSTMTPDNELSPYNGLLSRMWEVNYN